MPLPLYLAMTGAEISTNALPSQLAYMACHFSPYHTGLSNLPESLPPHSLLILNDQIPVDQHDPDRICRQLSAFCEKHRVSGLLLDFERPKEVLTLQIAQALSASLSCPVAVTEAYAEVEGCCVLLLPRPYEKPEAVAGRWPGRKLWLELSTEAVQIRVDAQGAHIQDLDLPMELPHYHAPLATHYQTSLREDHVRFQLSRTREDLETLLSQAEGLGFTCGIGLFQELGK